MVINELKQNCARCKGTGNQPGFSSLGINQINYDGRCPICQGKGYQLTELGEDLVKLLRPVIEEMIETDRLAHVPEPAQKDEPEEGRQGQTGENPDEVGEVNEHMERQAVRQLQSQLKQSIKDKMETRTTKSQREVSPLPKPVTNPMPKPKQS